jgi:hypothetical protein
MSKLERATHVCLILACTVSLGLLLERRFLGVRPISASAPGAATLIGRHLNVPGLVWNTSSINTVLFMDTHCSICNASMPFYRTVGETRRQRGAMRFFVVSAESPEVVAAHLQKEGVSPDGVYRIPQTAGLRGTPTLLVVDEQGIVRRAFEGGLTPARQEELLKVLRNGEPL